jgi:hypothetical protein
MPGSTLEGIRAALAAGSLIPYLGPGMLELVNECPVPATPETLSLRITGKVQVPHKLRKRLTAAAQFIENFKHRKTLVGLMRQSFGAEVLPSALHCRLAMQVSLPLVVDAWYDDAMQNALRVRKGWGQVQGLSQAEHPGSWYGWYGADGSPTTEGQGQQWDTLLYKPLGGVAPADNFIVSDSDYVEVLTEIDIQTPIPARVQELRRDRSFVFLGCRFDDQLQRSFARQIMKRSSGRHWAVLHGELTRNELRFLDEQHIERIDMTLFEFETGLIGKIPD